MALKRESKKSFVQLVIEKGLESSDCNSTPSSVQSVGELSAGGNCQADSWYRSNLTPLRLAALVIVQKQVALPK